MTVEAVEARAAQILDRTRAVNLRPLLKKLGSMMDTESRSAFIMQRWGPFIWDPKYPNQEGGDFISVAGALEDFNQGRDEPRLRQFIRRPALMGRRSLFSSITHRIIKRNVLEQGSWLDYAKFHQHGLVDVQHISDSAKRKMKEWFKTPLGSRYEPRLRFLVRENMNTLDTEIVQRPFVGIHDEMETRIRRTIEGYFNA